MDSKRVYGFWCVGGRGGGKSSVHNGLLKYCEKDNNISANHPFPHTPTAYIKQIREPLLRPTRPRRRRILNFLNNAHINPQVFTNPRKNRTIFFCCNSVSVHSLPIYTVVAPRPPRRRPMKPRTHICRRRSEVEGASLDDRAPVRCISGSGFDPAKSRLGTIDVEDDSGIGGGGWACAGSGSVCGRSDGGCGNFEERCRTGRDTRRRETERVRTGNMTVREEF